jgi:hypothetical protein
VATVVSVAGSSPGCRRHSRQRALGVFGANLAREWSAIGNVACTTVTTSWQCGHCGFIVLPANPLRYESGAWQYGQGPNHAYAINCA